MGPSESTTRTTTTTTTTMPEELSESSRSSSSSSSSSGNNSGSDTEGPTTRPPAGAGATEPGFHPYKGPGEHAPGTRGPAAGGVALQRLAGYASGLADGAELPMALDKPKDYATQRGEVYISETELQGQKEAMFTFCREIREIRQKSLHAALERGGGGGAAATAKDLEMIKNYGLPIDRIKDFGGLSRIGSIALDRLRVAPLAGESSEVDNLKNLQQLQSRVAPGPAQIEATMAFERLRHSHQIFQSSISNDSTDQVGGATIAGQFVHSHQQQQQQPQQIPHHHHHQHHHHAVTQITQMQHGNSQHHQSQQQQPKSFTIDAILGLRGAGQREKHQRHHPYRKHQGHQEGATKSLSSGGGGGGSCITNGSNGAGNNAVGGGKLKRVRTIFTAEQLERLEDEFARQQYMVGPERLYLAHALRLTEAQVKVWFQNRRIKWRKLNHEQQSQRLHDLQQSGLAAASERDDSSENAAEW